MPARSSRLAPILLALSSWGGSLVRGPTSRGDRQCDTRTLVLRDGSGGASFAYLAANHPWAYMDFHFQSLECGAFQTVGGAFENMAKYAEDFTAATCDKNGGSCPASATPCS